MAARPLEAQRFIAAQFVKAGCSFVGASRLLGIHEKHLHRIATQNGFRPLLEEKRRKHRAMLAPPGE